MNSITKIDPVALEFIGRLIETKARMLETAARVANETDSNLHRVRVLEEITDSCTYIDSLLARGEKEE